MHVLEQPKTDTFAYVDDSSTLASLRDDQTRPRKQGKRCPKCEHCGKLSHKIDKCYALHECEHCGKPGHKIDRCYRIVWSSSSLCYSYSNQPFPIFISKDPPSSVSSDTPTTFNKILKWYKDQQSSSSTTFVAHTSTSFVGLTRSSSLGPWVFYSGATDHITGNKSLFSLSFLNPLPSATLTEGSRNSSHGVGTIKIFPLTIDNVLYIPGSPFNLLSDSHLTRSLDCVVSFTNNFVYLQDQILKQVICTRCESHGLYHLRPSTHIGAVMESPSLFHAQLGHPSLAKLHSLSLPCPSYLVWCVSRVN